ncbi:hypothetical protein HC752_14790 [Vibrio sp. S9_S30]|uniref:hypothetical protein n=1 Tax=Vibrio sp. S9_S30 TaxID=2720226 RepID=UPI0016800F48|nr:hypothetical protein [Vibrio sp. S9_S30]MBD1558202.1 hypothetical protein [Vibrio sp. S9_S30]
MRILIFVFIAFLSISVHAAGREASGTVQLYATAGNIIVSLSGSNQSCGNRYYFKPDTDYNRALLSMLLAAQMSNKRVWVNGEGSCISDYPFANAYKLINMSILP